ncbi:MAG TPA: hypothetical protein VHE99_04060 [Gammaproteobacteria bacterium]|nr:hypothetical protein [Gammaproteobacteria bacterium]
MNNFFSHIISFGLSLGLIFQIWLYWKNSVYKKSEAFLNEIKNSFDNATNLISSQDNTSSKWHAATNSLRQCIALGENLKIKEHKIIYVVKYLDVIYKITCQIMAIDSPEFFSGVRAYQVGSVIKQLVLMTEPKLLTLSYTNPTPELIEIGRNRVLISCAQLSFLLRFLGKAQYFHKENFGNTEKEYKKVFVFLTNKIEEEVLTHNEISDYCMLYPVVVEYIKIYVKYFSDIEKGGKPC